MAGEVSPMMVQRLTNAYVYGLNAADKELSSKSFEQRLARTVLAESASSALNLLETRSVSSKAAKEPLADFVARLDPKEGIRPTLDKVDAKVNAAAKALAIEAAKQAIGLQAAWWFTALVGLITGALLLLADIGAAFALFLLSGGALASFLVARSSLIASAASKGVSTAYTDSIEAVNRIGAAAEALVKEHTAGPEREFYVALGRTPPTYGAIETVRSRVQAAVIALWCVAGVAVVAVVWGFVDVLSAVSQ